MHSRCPVTANAISSQLLNNERLPDADRDFARCTLRECASFSRATTADANLSSDFTVDELEAAIKKLKLGKAPIRDNIQPEFVIPQSTKTTAWLRSFFTSCFPRFKLPKTWRRATVVALPITTCTRPQVVQTHRTALRPVQDSGEVDIQPHRPSGGPTASSGTSRLPPW